MRALTSYLAFTSSFFGQDTTSGTEIVKSNLPFSRPYEPICDDPNFATYDQSEPDDYCYVTYGDHVSENHYVYFEHLESNQIYTCNSYEVQKLIDQGVDLNSVEYQGLPILYHAVKNGYSSIVKMLLNAGASYDFKMPDGKGLLHIAAEQGHYHVFRDLITEHPSLKHTSLSKLLSILLNSDSAKSQVYEFVDAKDSQNTTPLIIASKLGHAGIVNILLDHGASINHIDDNRQSARTVADLGFQKNDIPRKYYYEHIVKSLAQDHRGNIESFSELRASMRGVISLSSFFLFTFLLIRSESKNSHIYSNLMNEMLCQIKERGALSAEEIELLKEKLPLVCAISHEELTSSDEIYCIEDIKNLYVPSELVTWIKRTAKFSDDRNDITFINPITNQRVSINRIFDATIPLHKFLESEEGLDQSQSQAASADEQEADPLAAAANAFAAMVSRQRQMRASGQSL